MKNKFRNHLSVSQNVTAKTIAQLKQEVESLKTQNNILLHEIEARGLLIFEAIPTDIHGEKTLLDFIKAEKELDEKFDDTVSEYQVHFGEKKKFSYLKAHWNYIMENGIIKFVDHIAKVSQKMKENKK